MDFDFEKEDTFETECLDLTPIQQFYYGKSVFITGATGLVGKVVFEKILRCCPGVKKIYVLLRPMKSMNAEQRLQKLLKSKIFSHLDINARTLKEKVCAIEGDVVHDGLGLVEKDQRELENNVNILVNSCARINVFESLKKSCSVNVIGIKNILDFSRRIKNLESFVHLSTYIANRLPNLSVPERVMKLPMSAQQMLNMLEWMDEETAEALKPHLVDWRLIPYAFCKGLTEQLILEQYSDLPVIILRPCLLSATYKQPFPGFVDLFQSLNIFVYAVSKGILKCIYAIPNMKVLIMTTDYVANTVLASAWFAAKNVQKEVLVVNCVPDSSNTLTLENVEDLQSKMASKIPLANIFRYPSFAIYYNRLAFFVASFYYHYLPALFADIVLYVTNGKTKMLKMVDVLHRLTDTFATVVATTGPFELTNYNAIENSLSKEDREIFYMDTKAIDWPRHVEEWLFYMREALGKEDPSNIEYAKTKLKIWYVVSTILQWWVILYLIGYFLEIVFPAHFT